MEDAVLNLALSVISMLFIATLVAFFLKNSKIPYTVVLVLVGVGMGYAIEHIEALSFLEGFRLSPELVFYVFLPTLIFESAFHTNVKHFTQNIHAIVSLATIGMLFSAVFVAFGTHYWLGLPWEVALLFGALISATDPISVLALFKKIGVPKRLSTLVEGESLFNDGTALVLFGIFLSMATGERHFNSSQILGSLANFGLVVFGGIGVGLIMGFLFSKALDYVKNSQQIEISITLILAHATFIVAEYFFGVSGILATVAAGIVIGNYGAYKISPSVKETMSHFWDYSAFLANSILFLMVGAIVYSVKDSVVSLLEPTLIVIALVLVSRMLIVYTLLPLMNWVYPREKIPTSWMHVIQWSGLRGALAIALILTLPESFVYYEELLIFTVGVIVFTIVFNGLTIQPLLSLLGLQSFSTVESFENDENQVIIDRKVMDKLREMQRKGFISKDVYEEVGALYKEHEKDCTQHIKDLCLSAEAELDKVKLAGILKRHLLGIERHAFTKLYYHGEITQELLNILLNNVAQQVEVDSPKTKVKLGRLTLLSPDGRLVWLLERFGVHGLRDRLKRRHVMLRYEMYRARLIATSDVLDSLKTIRKTKAFLDKSLLDECEIRYKKWYKKAQEKLKALEKKDAKSCHAIQIFLAKQAAFHVEDKTLRILQDSGMTSPKVYNQLKRDLELRREALIA